MKLELTLGHPTGKPCEFWMTGLGGCLYSLSQRWNMTYEQIIEKLVCDAAIKDDEENIVDGVYRRPERTAH